MVITKPSSTAMDMLETTNPTPAPQVTPPVASNNDVDYLDKLFGSYSKPMEVTPEPSKVPPVSAAPNAFQNSAPTQNPNNTPFGIHRDVNANAQPVQEYYKTGKKAGQPKPPKRGQPAPPPPQPNVLAASTLISGAMFIILIDLLMPMSICGLNNLFNKEYKLDPDKMKMTDKQKSELSTVGDAVVRELKITASPSLLFLLTLFGIYGFNAVLLINSQKREQEKLKRKEDEKNIKNATQNHSGKIVAINTP